MLKSKQILGTKPNSETITELQKTMNIPANTSIALMVFEITYNKKIYYGCWSGGAMQNGQPKLTLVGQAAFEALINLPIDNDNIIFQELKLGKTSIQEKIKATLDKAPEKSKICFFGDMQNELDGQLVPGLNFSGETVDIAH